MRLRPGGEKRFAAGGSGENPRLLIERLLGLGLWRIRGRSTKADEWVAPLSASTGAGLVGLESSEGEQDLDDSVSKERTVAPAELGMKVTSVLGVIVKSETSLMCCFGMMMSPWGNGNAAGDGDEDGGDRGSGVIGLCQDWTLWNESVEPTGDVSSGT